MIGDEGKELGESEIGTGGSGTAVGGLVMGVGESGLEIGGSGAAVGGSGSGEGVTSGGQDVPNNVVGTIAVMGRVVTSITYVVTVSPDQEIELPSG